MPSKKIVMKVGALAMPEFLAALNKLTAYPRASFADTYRLSQAKRAILKAVDEHADNCYTVAKKYGKEDEAKRGVQVPVEKRPQCEAEMRKLGEREIKIPLTERIKVVSNEVPEKYFTPEDLYQLDPLIEVIEAPLHPTTVPKVVPLPKANE